MSCRCCAGIYGLLCTSRLDLYSTTHGCRVEDTLEEVVYIDVIIYADNDCEPLKKISAPQLFELHGIICPIQNACDKYTI